MRYSKSVEVFIEGKNGRTLRVILHTRTHTHAQGERERQREREREGERKKEYEGCGNET